VTQVRFFDDGTVPEYATPEWYATRERAPHLEQTGHRARLDLAAEFVRDAHRRYGLCTLSDMGAGDGGLLSILDCPGLSAWGYDLEPANIVGSMDRGVRVTLTDVLNDDIVWGDIVVCTETLEHLVDPHGFVRTASENARVIIASSPDGETEENHYEFHLWGFDKAGYRELIEQGGFEVVRHETVPGFQVLMGAHQ
jgi:2-polyprenyl-3-methyl-5-hydroxy-6-metoxy-1,4-benzoquinol methylase